MNIPGTEKPTEKSVSDWFGREWRRWAGRRELDEQVRARLFRKHEVDSTGPNGEEAELNQVVLRSGVTRTLLREFVGIMTSDQPRIEALADGVGLPSSKAAGKIEEWDAAWYQDVEGDDLCALIDADQLSYGRGVSYVAWARQYWDGGPERDGDEPAERYNKKVASFRRGRPQPIYWQHCPAPQTMFDGDLYDRFYGPPGAVCWEHRHLSELAAQYPKSDLAARWRKAQDEDPHQLWLCFANRKWMVYATADGTLAESPETGEGPLALLSDEVRHIKFLVEPFEHGQDANPFTVQLGDVSSDPELVHKYAGIFDNSLNLIDRIDETLTQYATSVRRYARAVPIVTRTWGPGGQAPYGYDTERNTVREVDWNPNRVTQFGPGETPGWWQPPVRDFQAAVDLHTIISQYIQRDTLAPSSWGGGVATESGYQLVTLIQASERKLKPFLRRKSKSLQQTINNVHALVVHIGSAVEVRRDADEDGDGGSTVAIGGFVSLSPKQAEKARVRVKISPRLDSAEAANMQLLLQVAQAVSAGFIDIDKDYLLSKYGGIENPERHRKAALIQRFLASDEMIKWMTQYALREAQMQLEKDDVNVIQALSQLTPAELMLAPQALQQVLAERGLIAPGATGLPPNPGTVGADGGSGLNALLGQAAMQGAPAPGQPGTVPGSAPANPLAQYTGGGPPTAFMGAAQAGQPAALTQAGPLG